MLYILGKGENSRTIYKKETFIVVKENKGEVKKVIGYKATFYSLTKK